MIKVSGDIIILHAAKASKTNEYFINYYYFN